MHYSSPGLAEGLSGVYLPPTHQTLVLAPNGWVGDRDGRPGARLSRPAISGTGKQSARSEATQENAPAMCVGVVSLHLVSSFTMGRTKADVNPPAAVTGVDTRPQLSVALGTPFHSCSRCLTRANRAENNTVPRSYPQSSAHYVDRRTGLRPLTEVASLHLGRPPSPPTPNLPFGSPACYSALGSAFGLDAVVWGL